MGMMDDETLRMYVEESREHLANIENDLLTIEGTGADIDEDLVNKVFRAAHSLKGGAGFLGLTRIKELAHKIENVLDMIRSRELVPVSDVVNVLLLSFDRLRELVNNVDESNSADIAEFVDSLTSIASANLPQARKESVTTTVDILLPGGGTAMRVSELDLAQAEKGGRFLYLVEYDLIHDVHQEGKTPLDILKVMLSSGNIVESAVDIAAVGQLDDDPSNRIPFYVLFASIIDPDLVASLLDVPASRIHPVRTGAPVAAAPLAAAPASPPPPPAAPAPLYVPEPAPQPVLMPVHREEASPAPEAAQAEHGQEQGKTAGAGQGETSLRVNVALLEALMNLAGELVLSRNQLLQAIAQNDGRSIQASGQRISLVTSELQEAIMLTRMQPIGNIFNKFPRVVRDLAKILGKDVRLNLAGKEVEMDKTIIEALSDPLTHLVRNAVDHGIETPEVRSRTGKSVFGVVNLKAYHEAGHVNIEISDDGKGIDPKKIAQAATTKGLVTAEQVRAMSDKEMMALLFLPGLSTAEKVTDVSGRGVGMDVVKTNLDRLGGLVDIDSEIGKGSIFRIKLPLTLAIIPSLLVSVSGERFAVPQVNVDELIRIAAAQVKERIELVGDAEVLILRGEMIPIIHLASVLDIPRSFVDPEDGQRKADRRERIADRRSKASPLFREGDRAGAQELGAEQVYDRRDVTDRRTRPASDLNIVIVSAGTFRYGLVVDELHDSVEIVVKPLGHHLKGCRGYAGATIMGDGRVALIVDVAGLAGVAGLASLGGTTRAAEIAEEARRERLQDVQSLLLFRNAPEEQCAVPLDLVARVELAQPRDIELLGGRKVMQYRGGSLPLFALRDVADVRSLPEGQDLIVIVFRIAGREIGLLATGPVDALETRVAVDNAILKQKGIMGSAVIHDRTTLLVDIFELVETACPDWFTERPKAVVAEKADAPCILLAEDSEFFRSQVKKFIEADGYKVVVAVDGLEAWQKLQDMAERISLVVTDIEMPNMDGIELTRAIKGDNRFSGLPVIAVTSLAGEEDMARGKAAGVDDYQIKLDREKLMDSIHGMLHAPR